MATIVHVRGDATSPQGEGMKIIAHVRNDLGGWGRGLCAGGETHRWPEPEAAYRRRHRERAGNDFRLGAVPFVRMGPYPWIANMIGQRGIRRGDKGVPVRYEAIDTALGTVAAKAVETRASVHRPRTGCGLAGGRWSHVEPLMARRLVARGVHVTVYDHDG